MLLIILTKNYPMNKKCIVLLLFLIFINSTFSQTKSTFDLNTYINTISIEDLKEHLTIVASDEMEGRDTGTEGQKKAGVYLINTYKKMEFLFQQEQVIFIKKYHPLL